MDISLNPLPTKNQSKDNINKRQPAPSYSILCNQKKNQKNFWLDLNEHFVSTTAKHRPHNQLN